MSPLTEIISSAHIGGAVQGSTTPRPLATWKSAISMMTPATTPICKCHPLFLDQIRFGQGASDVKV